MLIENIAADMARQIKNIVPDHPKSYEVIKHGISIFINTVSIIILTVLISFFSGHLYEVIITMVGFLVLRMFSGGYHLKTGASCVVITSLLFTIISFISMSDITQYFLIAFSSILVLRYSPSNIEDTIIPEKFYPYLKLISFVLVLQCIWILEDSLTLSLFVQALLLIHRKEVNGR